MSANGRGESCAKNPNLSSGKSRCASRVASFNLKSNPPFCESWRGGRSFSVETKVGNLQVCRASRFEANLLKIKLTVGKVGRGGNKDTPNKSLDVRAKQLLFKILRG